MKNANPVSILWRAAVVLAVLPMTAGCGRGDAVSAAAEARPATEFFAIAVGGRPVKMQLAITQSEMERGLMGRRDLGTDEGMLFLYEAPQQMSFWMRNTPTPLDIGFFTVEGVLKEVYPMYPFDETPVTSRSRELRLALEMKQGWFEFNDVKPGARLDLKALAAAIRARGFEPKDYGVP